MIRKYGKSYKGIWKLKRNYTSDNDKFLHENQEINLLYKKQPQRKKCKICGKEFTSLEEEFIVQGVNYIICSCCGHVNGGYLETEEFTSWLYQRGDYGGGVYFENSKNQYESRVKNIYEPKVEYMEEVFRKVEVEPKKFDYLDVGCGSGYYVTALDACGYNVKGIEVSKEQVQFANEMLGKELCVYCEEKKIVEYILNTSAQVVSFIGVLEHVINLDEILEALKTNDKIKYIYFCVPKFCFSVFLAAVFPDIYARTFGYGHTHIFTESSLDFLCKKYHWKVLGRWDFGADAADLFRALSVKLEKSKNSALFKILDEKILSLIDDIQIVFDKNDLSSEIHMLVEKI